jgi:hypothetical protein
VTALATIHVGLKQLGIAEEDARDLYERMAGERSLRAMTPAQHQSVIGELHRLGFRAKSNGSRKRLEGKYAPKLQALWIAAYNLGLIRNKDDAALLAFVKRQTGLDHTQFLRYSDDAASAIEALKIWTARDGGVDWSKSRYLPVWTQANGYRIARAQHQRLIGLAQVSPLQSLDSWLCDQRYEKSSEMRHDTWISAMNKMGVLIRAAQVTTTDEPEA